MTQIHLVSDSNCAVALLQARFFERGLLHFDLGLRDYEVHCLFSPLVLVHKEYQAQCNNQEPENVPEAIPDVSGSCSDPSDDQGADERGGLVDNGWTRGLVSWMK